MKGAFTLSFYVNKTKKGIIKMKNLIKKLFSLALCLALVLSFAACGNAENASNPESSVAQSADSGDAVNTIEKTGVWADAVLVSDTEIGEGEKTVKVEISAENQKITLTVKTNATTVGAALIENNIIEGEESQYGLYIKKVNGITADYNVNKAYWAFYVNGEYAMSGVDSTNIDESVTYKLEYTK